MTGPVLAGAVYFLMMFALGFVLGSARTMILAAIPGADHSVLVMIELPVMLAASWVSCGWLVRRYAVPSGWVERLVMGGVGFVLLMVAEAMLALVLLGLTLGAHVASYGQPTQAMGLLAQIAFGLFPLFRRGTPAG